MAMTLIAKPYSFSPAYNELKYIYDSTNKNQLGFKYIFQVLQYGGSQIAEYRLLPQVTTGYGEQDLSKLLSTKVSYDLNSGTTYNAANSLYQYDVRIGEEYITGVNYTASLSDNGGNVKITITHAFVVGDKVRIAQADNGVANPQLEGLFVVTAITGTTDFTVSALWSDVTDATINGSVYYADNRKTQTLNIVTVSRAVVFNAAFSWLDWINYNESNYDCNAYTDLLLTSIPQTGFYATVDQDLIVNVPNRGTATGFMYFENSNGSVFKKAITNANNITGVTVGVNNVGTLTTVSGPGGLVEDDTTWYDFYYTNAAGTQYSVKYRVNIDRRCKIEDYEIKFLDRMGSFPSFAFQLRSYDKGNVQRKEFNTDVTGYASSNRWQYYSTEFGMSTSSVLIDKTIELNTNYMTEEMAILFEELVSTPLAFIKIGGTYQAVQIVDTSFDVEKAKNKHLIRKSITVKPSNQNVVNG
jgi:hypothetical protein